MEYCGSYISLDFKKAFDSINRSKMMRIFKAYGVPSNLLRAIEAIYTNTRVITPDKETEEFDILAGVLQGDTLAAFLFIIILDYAMRQPHQVWRQGWGLQ